MFVLMAFMQSNLHLLAQKIEYQLSPLLPGSTADNVSIVLGVSQLRSPGFLRYFGVSVAINFISRVLC